MRGLILALIEGSPAAWVAVAVLWAIAGAFALLHTTRREASPTQRRVILLLAVASVIAPLAIPVATALAVPRMRWRDVAAPDLVASSGESWRKLRGPLVAFVRGGAPEVAVPTIDARGRWVLYGLLRGRVIEDLPPAPDAPAELGGPRLCKIDGEGCRAWPSTWPDPQKAPSVGELVWSHDDPGAALAYDVDAHMFLRAIEGDSANEALEVVGRVSNEAPRDTASALFAIRGVGGGRLYAARVVATPLPSKTAGEDVATHSFRLQRAEVSLDVGPAMLRFFARPLLIVLGLSLPLGLAMLLLAPSLLARALQRRGAERVELARAAVLVPLGDARREATVAEPMTLPRGTIERGARVSLLCASPTNAPVAARAWFVASSDDAAPAVAPAEGEGLRRAATAWMAGLLAPLSVLAIGLALAAPAIVALATLAAAR